MHTLHTIPSLRHVKVCCIHGAKMSMKRNDARLGMLMAVEKKLYQGQHSWRGPAVFDPLIHDKCLQMSKYLLVRTLYAVGLMTINKTEDVTNTQPGVEMSHNCVVKLRARIGNE